MKQVSLLGVLTFPFFLSTIRPSFSSLLTSSFFTPLLSPQGIQHPHTHAMHLNNEALPTPEKNWYDRTTSSCFRLLQSTFPESQDLFEVCRTFGYSRGVTWHTNAETWLLQLSVGNKWMKVPLKKNLPWFEANTEKVFNEQWVSTRGRLLPLSQPVPGSLV